MEQLIAEITILGWLNIALWFGYLCFVILLVISNRQKWWRMIVGEDGIPQPIEGFLALWFITAPILVASVMMFNVVPPHELWTFMEIIGPAGVFGKIGKDFVNKNRLTVKKEDEP